MTNERLYGLLPAFYRNRDAEEGEPLRALCAILDTQLLAVEADIAALYENWFIETCAEWVVPYIGDLLRTRPLNAIPAAGFSARPYVARTLAYRRGKGTVTSLASLARDVTGWPAHVAERFSLLSTTQHLDHLRPTPGGTLDLRDANRLELLGGPFEAAPYTVDVRMFDGARGRYNLPNLDIAVWRLQAYPLVAVSARAANPTPDGRYYVNPLGIEAPLFNQPARTLSGGTPSELDVPGALRRRPLYDELEALRQALVDGSTPAPGYFSAPPVFALSVAGTAILPEQLLVCNVDDDPANPGDWLRPPAAKAYVPAGGGAAVNRPIAVALDPVRGRLAFPRGATSSGLVTVDYSYALGGEIGGGPYDRTSSLSDVFSATVTWQVAVGRNLTAAPGRAYSTLTAAVQAWNAAPSAFGVIAVVDSATYVEQLTGADAVTIPANCRLLIVAAQWPQVAGPAAAGPAQLLAEGIRPHLLGSLEVQGSTAAAGTPLGQLIVNGLAIEGGVLIGAGDLGSLTLVHSSVVPAAGVTVASGNIAGQENATLSISLVRSVCGPITVPPDALESRLLSLSDSILASNAAGDPTKSAILAGNVTGAVTGTTVFGQASLAALEASNSIFTGMLSVARRQSGCIRFSYVPPSNSQTPRRYRCQPDTALQGITDAAEQINTAARVAPRFSSIAYGGPDYAQLARDCAPEIAIGADNGSEMGALSFLQQPQRTANLAASLGEYLRFGLNASITYAT